MTSFAAISGCVFFWKSIVLFNQLIAIYAFAYCVRWLYQTSFV